VQEIPGRKTVALRRGDRLRMLLPGGGGYGDPLQRDPELVAADVANRKVSRDAALRYYGVVITDRGVDSNATASERSRHKGTTKQGG
jgi:N-methylhydantoinase B